MALLEFSRERFRRLPRELRDFCAPRRLHDVHEIIHRAARQRIQPERANGLRLEINFRPELTAGDLQPHAERRHAVKIHEDQIVLPVAVNVRHLNGFGRAGIWNLRRLRQRVIFLLREKKHRAVVAQQSDVSHSIAVQIADGKCVRIEPTVLDVPALRLAPAVRAEIVTHDQILRIAKINQIWPTVAVHIRHHEGGDAFLRGNRINVKTRTRRQIV